MFSKSLIVLVAAVCALADQQKSLTASSIGFLYKELGCKPVYKSSNLITHFDCSEYGAGPKNNGCKYKGEIIGIGSDLPPHKTNPCVAACKCMKNPVSGLPAFTCAHVECPEWPNAAENCTYLYRDDRCCHVKKHCANDGPLPTCFVDGKVYLEGQKFYPQEEPCKVCHCKAGFSGKFVEPFCKDAACEIELHYSEKLKQKCVPVYFGEKGCCPIEWRCPSKKDEVINFTGNAVRTTEATCEFGNLKFRQYDMLNTHDPKLLCSCMIPPFLTCTQRS